MAGWEEDIKLMVSSAGACLCLATRAPLEVRNETLPKCCYREADKSSDYVLHISICSSLPLVSNLDGPG